MDPVIPYAPEADRNLDPDTAHAVAIMLDTYCHWLNDWYANEYEDARPYRPTVFLDYRPPQHLWGRTEIAAIYDTTDHTVLALRIHDGDDGGPHGLTGWFEEYPRWHTPTHGPPIIVGYDQELHHMTQEFDTDLQLIMQDGKLINTPTTKDNA